MSFGDGLLIGEVIEVVEEGNRLIKFHYEGIFEEVLDQLGEMPLPPYITHQLTGSVIVIRLYMQKTRGLQQLRLQDLHFTSELLDTDSGKGC